MLKKIAKNLLKFKFTNFCTKINTEVQHHQNDIKSDIVYSEELKNEYNTLIDEHNNSLLPYSDKEFYTNLFYFSSNVPDNANLHSWDILLSYIKYNIDTLDKEFLLDVLQQYSRMNYSNFEFWYYIERRLTKDIKLMTNKEIAIATYSFGHVGQGSNYIYTSLAKAVMDKGIRTFTEDEFIMLYNGFKNSRVRDKMLWAILERARKELYLHLTELE
jgi:hypothetical protein